MRKVKFEGWIIFDEEECNHGKSMVGQIEHELFNLEGAVEWELKEISNEEIEYEYDEDEDNNENDNLPNTFKFIVNERVRASDEEILYFAARDSMNRYIITWNNCSGMASTNYQVENVKCCIDHGDWIILNN